MNDYLLLYLGGDPNWHENSTAEERAEVMQAWGAWFQQLEAGGHLRNPGAALLPDGAALSAGEDGIATDTSMAEVKELIGGYSVIAAESLEHAIEAAKGCPSLMDPSSKVVVRRIMTEEEYG